MSFQTRPLKTGSTPQKLESKSGGNTSGGAETPDGRSHGGSPLILSPRRAVSVLLQRARALGYSTLNFVAAHPDPKLSLRAVAWLNACDEAAAAASGFEH